MSRIPKVKVEVALIPSAAALTAGWMLLDTASHDVLGTNTYAGDNEWTDISSYVRSISLDFPASRVQGPLWQYQGASGNVVLKNDDGRFDPENTSSPYYVSGKTQILPMVPVRLTCTRSGNTYDMIYAFADSWDVDDSNLGPNYEEITLNFSDAFKILAGITLAEQGSGIPATGDPDDTGAQIERILNAGGWYESTAYRNLDTGESWMQRTTYGSDMLSLCQLAVDSEIGEFYIDHDGAVRFRSRSAILTESRSRYIQATFGDSPGTTHTAGEVDSLAEDQDELPYEVVGRADDDTTLANDVQATINGSSNMQEATDSTSQGTYIFPRTYERSDLILITDDDALAWAQYVLYVSKDNEVRVDSLTVNPKRDETTLYAQVLGRQRGDKIWVWRRPPGVSAGFAHEVFIRGIHHSIDYVADTWQTVWDLQDASKYADFLLADDSSRGILGTNTYTF